MREATPAEIRLTHVIYALQAAGFLAVVTWLVAVAAVIINYIKRDDIADTFLASHYRWQIRTFWYSLLWAVIGAATYLIVIGYVILLADFFWVLYRIIKGWLRLAERKAMYAT